MTATSAAGDTTARELIEVHVGTLKPLFNSMDPSPFRDRDLDPKVDAYCLGTMAVRVVDATAAAS